MAEQRTGEAALINGPLDGQVVDVSKAGAYAWFDLDGLGYDRYAPGSYLYRSNGRRWYFAGHGARECDGCGSVLGPNSDAKPLAVCPLCGAT